MAMIDRASVIEGIFVNESVSCAKISGRLLVDFQRFASEMSDYTCVQKGKMKEHVDSVHEKKNPHKSF